MVRGRDALRRRLDPDAKLGLRLTLAAGGAFVVAVPFGILAVLTRDRRSPVQRFDLHVEESVHTAVAGHAGLVQFFHGASTYGSPNVWRVVVGVGALALVRKAPRLSAWMVVTTAGSAALLNMTKLVVGRARPHFADPLATAPGKSFPSGHAMDSLVAVGVILLVVLPLLPRWSRVPAIAVGAALVVLIGGSRVALGVHYPSDVVGGWLLGGAWLAATTAAFASWRHAVGRRRPSSVTGGIEPDLPAEIKRR